LRRISSRYFWDLSRDTLICIGLLSTGLLYGMTDRYFASLLDTGSLAIIGYSGEIVSNATTMIIPLTYFFLARGSELNQDEALLTRAAANATGLFVYYGIPASFAIAAVSPGLVRLLLGRWNFDAGAQSLTAFCLMAQMSFLVFTLASMVTWRYLQVVRRTHIAVGLNLVSVLLNVPLDWLFSRWWGVVGILLATGVSTILNYLLMVVFFLPNLGKALCALPLGKITLSCAIWALPGFFVFRDMEVPGVLGVGLLFFAWLFAAEKYGLFERLAEEWRPSSLMGHLRAAVRRRDAG
jgi:peptidoglycan biosynthesis protein MviN/MurJ (putative lipid II flippase)